MDNHRSEQNEEIIKAAALGIFLGCLVLMITYLVVSGHGIGWPWWPGIGSTVICALSALIALPIAFIGRRAYQFHGAIAVVTLASILPLLAAGFELTSWSILQIAWVVLLCAINAVITYRWTIRRFTDPGFLKDKNGRMDAASGFWNLRRPLFSDSNKETGTNLARLLIPLASGVGAILYRIFPGQDSLLPAALMFVVAFSLVSLPALHFAAAVYLIGLERRTRKRIRI